MLIFVFRAIIIYVMIMFSMRLLGKRQIGQMQPAELVVTFLLSEIFSIPMQDVSIPLSSMIVPVLLIVSLEMLTSVISLKSIKFRQLLQGNSIILIKDGKLDQSQLKSLRMTTDDLLEELRKKDVFDISTVQYAVVETDGSLSVMLKAGETGVKNKNMDYSTKEVTMPYVIVSDGRVIENNMSLCACDRKRLDKLLKGHNTDVSEVMLLTLDKDGNSFLIKKESV